MRNRFLTLAVVIAAAALISGCTKCGDFAWLIGGPSACHSGAPAQ